MLLYPEINSIESNDIREIATKLIEDVDDDLINVPASTSGKYHPPEERGPGGLVLHIARMMKVFNSGLNKHLGLTTRESDLVRLAIISHDLSKVFADRDRFGKFISSKNDIDEHQPLSVEVLFEYIKELDPVEIKTINNMILSHMGSWSTKNIQPETKLEFALTILDYIDSRDFIHVEIQ